MDGGEERVTDPATKDELQRKGLVIRGQALLAALVLTAVSMAVPS